MEPGAAVTGEDISGVKLGNLWLFELKLGRGVARHFAWNLQTLVFSMKMQQYLYIYILIRGALFIVSRCLVPEYEQMAGWWEGRGTARRGGMAALLRVAVLGSNGGRAVPLLAGTADPEYCRELCQQAGR